MSLYSIPVVNVKGNRELYGRVARATLVIMILSLIDKMLALAKEVSLAHQFGISAGLDVFNVAYALPGVTVLVFSGAFVSAFVPLYSDWQRRFSHERINSVTTSLFLIALACSCLLALAGYFSSASLFPILGYGFNPAQQQIGVTLEKYLIFLVLVEGSGIALAALLTAQTRFLTLYTAPILINLALIAFIWFGQSLGVFCLVWGTLTGALLKLLFLLGGAYRIGFRFSRPTPEKIELRLFAVMFLPLLGSELIANSNILIDQMMATQLSSGSVSALRYAYRINDLPVQLVVLATSKALFPFISKMAVAEDHAGLKHLFTQSFVFIALITFPAICVFTVFSNEIVAIVLQRGSFGSAATARTAGILFCYSLGLFFYSLSFVNAAFFAALRNPGPLFAMGAATVILNVFLNLVFMRFLGTAGIALSSTVVLAVACAVLFALLRRRLQNGSFRGLPANLSRIALAGLAMLVVICLLRMLMRGYGHLVYVPVSAAAGFFAYVAVIWILRTEEIQTCFQLIKSTLSPKSWTGS